MKNERTSARAAQIAGILLEMSDAQLRKWLGMKRPYVASVLADIRTIAASALTQAPDKPSRTREQREPAASELLTRFLSPKRKAPDKRDPPYAYEVSPSEHRKKFPYNVPTVAAKPKRKSRRKARR